MSHTSFLGYFFESAFPIKTFYKKEVKKVVG